MTRIGIDVYSALHFPRGMGIYTINFLKALAMIDKENIYILYSNIQDEENILPKEKNFIFKQLKAKGQFHYEQFVLPKECKKDKIEILHSPANTSPIFLSKKIKRILTLHDIIFLKKEIPLPNNKKQLLGRLYYALTTILNSKRADIILTPSEYSKNDIAHTLFINKNKIVVDTRGAEHFDISEATALNVLKKKYNIPDSYYFTLGGEAPSKNTEFLLEIFSNKNDKNLVVAGVKDLENSIFYNKYKNYSNIVFVPYISQEDIVGLYKNAEAFIFPSIYEGFGLPLLEAMKCECPIICANTSCLSEVAGGTALYFNPKDKTQLLNQINNLIENNALKNELIEKGKKRLNNYSWMNTAIIIKGVYNYYVS